MAEAERRLLTFSAGAPHWPDEVLAAAAAELPRFRGTGLAVPELGHRTGEWASLQEEIEARFRRLAGVPADREVLFLPGGPSWQFALLPLNLRRPGERADYVVTGYWSRRALAAARATGSARVAATGEENGFTRVPPPEDWDVDPAAAYLHVTTNNTVYGTRLARLPAGIPVPVVADATSDLLARRLPLQRFAVVYAGAQKNLGPAGLTVVVVRRDLLARAPRGLPPILRWRDHAAARSRLNTPPMVLAWLLGRMLEWIEGEGGLAEMERRARERARVVYEALEAHPRVYRLPAAREDRSWVNIVFRTRDAATDREFLAAARAAGLVGLAGHRSVGGLRASMYAGMPLAGARRLAAFLHEFARGRARNGGPGEAPGPP